MRGLDREFSPQSGRTKIVQRFIAGCETIFLETSPRSGRQRSLDRFVARSFCRPFYGLRVPYFIVDPALKCWAITGGQLPSGVDEQIAQLLGIAVELHDLPQTEFKTRLREEIKREALNMAKDSN